MANTLPSDLFHSESVASVSGLGGNGHRHRHHHCFQTHRICIRRAPGHRDARLRSNSDSGRHHSFCRHDPDSTARPEQRSHRTRPGAPNLSFRLHSLVHDEENGLKITDAKVFVCCPGRNFVTLKIYTDAGRVRPGRCDAERARAGRRLLLAGSPGPLLIGRDPFQTEDIWQYLYAARTGGAAR